MVRELLNEIPRTNADALDTLDLVSAWRVLDTDHYKRCPRCGENLARSQYSKSNSICKACKREYFRAVSRLRGVKPRKRLEPNAVEKCCPHCGVTKPRTEFHRNSVNSDGLHSTCKACVLANSRTNKRQSYNSEVQREWRETHKQYLKAYFHRRRARVHGLPSTLTDNDIRFALDYFQECCAVCDKPLNGLFHTAGLDHWIPIKSPDCPGTVPGNMVPLCHGLGGCNNRKHSTLPAEWLKREFPRDWRKRLARIEEFFAVVSAREVVT